MMKSKRMILVLLTMMLAVGCDQVTKVAAKSYLPRTGVISFADNTLRLDYNVNRGAVLSFEYCLPEKWRGAAVTVAVTAFLALLMMYLLFASALQPLSAVALSLFCGGGISNMLDRVVFGGYVIDFLDLGWGTAFRTSIFNVADAAIVSGLVLFAASCAWSLRPSGRHSERG